MQAFDYHRPPNLAAALKALASGQALAGGQSLLPAMKLGLAAPEALVDLADLPELRGIGLQGGELVIGASSTHAEVAVDTQVRSAIPALAELASHIGDRQVRHRGTLGGSLAHNDPAACYPAAVLALGATIHTTRRSIAAKDFFAGVYTTALEEGELITRVSFPLPRKAAWRKLPQPASRFSLVGVFVALTSQGARVAVTGGGHGVYRCSELEAALTARWSPEACEGVEVSREHLASDLHASADYRAAMVRVMTQRAVAAAP